LVEAMDLAAAWEAGRAEGEEVDLEEAEGAD